MRFELDCKTEPVDIPMCHRDSFNVGKVNLAETSKLKFNSCTLEKINSSEKEEHLAYGFTEIT